MGRHPHPQFEAIGHEAALRKQQGRRDYVISTALDFACGTSTVKLAMRSLGLLDKTPQPEHLRGLNRTGLGIRLTKKECDAISWCPHCGHIHIYLPCEWCANWSEGRKRATDSRMLDKKVHRRKMAQKKSWISRETMARQWRVFHNNAPPTKDG